MRWFHLKAIEKSAIASTELKIAELVLELVLDKYANFEMNTSKMMGATAYEKSESEGGDT